MIPRFAYNFGPYPNPNPDATRTRIEQHLQQLRAGFGGQRGCHSLGRSRLYRRVGRVAHVDQRSGHQPGGQGSHPCRHPAEGCPFVPHGGPALSLGHGAVEWPADHGQRGVFRHQPGSDRSHQDCFLASANDRGTWGRSGNPYDYDKAYVAANGRFAVVGGETCSVNPPRSDCPTALDELEYMHWSYLNLDYEPNVIQGFREWRFSDQIRQRLGYRFQLISAHYSGRTQPGATLQFDFQATNVGLRRCSTRARSLPFSAMAPTSTPHSSTSILGCGNLVLHHRQSDHYVTFERRTRRVFAVVVAPGSAISVETTLCSQCGLPIRGPETH